MSRATHGASTRWLWSAHQSLDPQNSLQKLVIRTRFCSHSLVEELLQSDSEVALRHAVASDCDEFVSGESALDLRGERNRTVRNHGENYDFYQHRAPEMKSISPVVGHVALDEVSCSQSRHQGELPRQHSAAHHPGQLTGVLTRLAGAGALNTEHLQTQTQFNVRERR